MHSLRARRCRISGQCVVERAASRCGRVAGLWMLRHEEEVLEEDVRPTWWLLLLLLRMTMSLLMLRSPARLAGGGKFVAIDEFWVGWEREGEGESLWFADASLLKSVDIWRPPCREGGREEGKARERERERERDKI